MVGGGMGRFWTSFALLAVVSAGPLHRYPRESEDYQNDESVYANYTANEVCFSEGEVFQKGDMMPNPGPCEECRCEPPSIVCNMVKCATNNNGCRTIQRPNHCCPDYNCECDYNGQLYNDGERLELPEEPCQVCYCKGGEVMCNSITCYHRDDCDPIHVPGQCCPKYENCPVRDMGSSSSDDKNVLVRSTNKTNHVPPKREMNPWLLTKVPSAASSSPPKSLQDLTTEGGTVVIVSDWLSERRTTTEEAARPYYNTRFTDEPDTLTSPGHLTTDFKQDFVSSGTNSDPFTPVDEVIFTRIDGQKVKEAKLEGPTSTSPKDINNSTVTFSLGNFTDPSTSEAPFDLRVTKLDLKQPDSSSDSPEKVTLSKADPPKTTVSNDISTEPPIKIQELVTNDGNIFSTATTTHTNNALEHIGNPVSNIDLTMKIPARDDQKEIIFENILGLEGLSLGGIEEDTTTKDFFGYYTTESEESATDINDLTEFAVIDQTKDQSRVGEVKNRQNEDESTSNDYSYTFTNSEFDNDVTTPFFIEVNVEKDNLDKHDQVTDLPKIIKSGSLDSNKSDMAISTSTPSDGSSTKGNTLLLETESTKTIDPIETKIKRNNLNGTEAQNNPINNTVTTNKLNDSSGRIPVSTKETIVVSEMNPKSQNVKVAPPNNAVNDFVLPTLVSSADKSDDSLESTSDTPVLELNSHVPFLQLGGHENTDPVVSTLAEQFQTTISNENDTEAADNNSKANFTSNSSDNLSLLAKQINSTNDISGSKEAGVDKNNEAIKRTVEHDEENDNVETETTTDIIYSTSHIPLSPGDLKVLAEYLINDTIKTVPGNNVSDYLPNPWLKGNLTSEEKMSSILSAANVSIAVMNKTEDKAKKYIKETGVKPSDVTKFEKKEQEKVLSGNDLKIENKTRFIQGKSDEYSDSPKINAEPETHLNDEPNDEATTTSKTTNTVLPNTKSPVKNTPAINVNTLAKLKTNTDKSVDKNSSEFQSYTPQPIKTQSFSQDSSDNILRVDDVDPVGSAEANEDVKNNLVRVAKSTDSTTPVTASHLQTQVTP